MAAVRDIISLVSFQIKTDKLLQVDKTDVNGNKTETNGSVRRVTIDFSPKKAFALLGLYIGLVNAEAPTIFLKIAQAFMAG